MIRVGFFKLFLSSLSMDVQVHGHEDDINAVAFADSSSHILFSGGDDGLCKVCQLLISAILQWRSWWMMMMKVFISSQDKKYISYVTIFE